MGRPAASGTLYDRSGAQCNWPAVLWHPVRLPTARGGFCMGDQPAWAAQHPHSPHLHTCQADRSALLRRLSTTSWLPCAALAICKPFRALLPLVECSALQHAVAGTQRAAAGMHHQRRRQQQRRAGEGKVKCAPPMPSLVQAADSTPQSPSTPIIAGGGEPARLPPRPRRAAGGRLALPPQPQQQCRCRPSFHSPWMSWSQMRSCRPCMPGCSRRGRRP